LENIDDVDIVDLTDAGNLSDVAELSTNEDTISKLEQVNSSKKSERRSKGRSRG
jgi:hypothetical protein